MSTLMKRSSLQAAERRIMADLMNSFLSEQLLPLEDHPFIDFATAPAPFRRLYKEYDIEGRKDKGRTAFATLDDGNESGIRVDELSDTIALHNPNEDKDGEHNQRVASHFKLHTQGVLCLVETGVRQANHWVQGSPIYEEKPDGSWVLLGSPVEVGRAVLQKALSDEAYAQPGVSEFLASLDIAVEQYALGWEQVRHLSTDVPASAYEWFIKGERVAALRDRPFHPSSKAKVGFNAEDVTRYAAEFGKAISLRWVAIRLDAVQQGGEDGLSILDILDDVQRGAVEAEFARKGITLHEYLPMPVHPWQLQHVILPHFTGEIEESSIVVLDVEVGNVQATSSLRSMAPSTESTLMLKLPVSVLSLGAARYLPVVKLLNGLAGERMLRQAVACDETLKDKVYMCEEQNWWGFMPASMGLFDDHPRHLAAQIRVYPTELLDEAYKVVPMAALGVNLEGHHLLTEILGENLSSTDVLDFYHSIATTFYNIVMRLFKVGVVPEIHGQNCCLVLRDQQVSGLLFRDHDSVRLHQPYLDKHGIADPAYHIRPGYSNSLYNETIQKLIFYVQSLGTQVNLAAIMEALSEVYHIPETKLWEITEQAWKEALQQVQLPESDRAALAHAIFESREWPVKLVVRPLLEADGVPGAMPSGKGKGWNPFYKG
ncbi:IucA/IucC family protein [Paenibacillus sp. QZ-Y1]|uniref:IucA/IucC family protein n=1 Tax=Paenibacillus sp. QZ-Y1 TaxID=3414511 RepID=UPI003F7A73F3